MDVPKNICYVRYVKHTPWASRNDIIGRVGVLNLDDAVHEANDQGPPEFMSILARVHYLNDDGTVISFRPNILNMELVD